MVILSEKWKRPSLASALQKGWQSLNDDVGSANSTETRITAMSAHRAKKRNANSSSYALLSNSLATGLMNGTTIRRALIDFLANEPESNFEERYSHLLKSKRIRAQVPAFYTSIADFSKNGYWLTLPTTRLIKILRAVVAASHDKLKTFITLSQSVEASILSADYLKADLILDEMQSKLGDSVWLCRTKMLVLSALGDREKFANYCAYCEQESATSFDSFIFKCAQLIADSDNAVVQLASTVGRNIRELKEARQFTSASVLQVLFYPYSLDTEIDTIRCLPQIQGYPIVDQYCMITTILRIELAKDRIDRPIDSELKSFSKFISEILVDKTTENFNGIEKAIEKGPYGYGESVDLLYKSYNCGDYPSVLRRFKAEPENSYEFLPHINVIAKGMAYSGFQSTLDSRTSPIMKVASALATIYHLSPLWSQAEELLVTQCIKFNHLAFNSHIQNALMKALPFRNKAETLRNVARLAVTLTNSCSLQTFILAGANSNIFHGFINFENIPTYRHLKIQVMDELSEPSVNVERVESLLLQLAETGLLKKDLLECRAAFFLQTRNDNLLLKEAAHNLVTDGTRFLCYPMDYLLQQIEDNELHDLNAIIVAHHFNKNISDERDYILNEAFEKYLSSSGKTRPSEFLSDSRPLGVEEVIFFKDVCVPDVMDYLECFKNSIELKSERIVILDALEARGVIDSKTRMREVEEIVRQVIVDTGTSGLNGAKVFVNDAALHRKHEEEIDLLLSLYNKIPEDGDDRYTQISTAKSEGGYVSGSRNGLVERLYHTILASFLLDEKYGLDKNLSGEIRHGFFSNLMRARLEELHLLTEINESGAYLRNQYWRERNNLVREEYWDEIDDVLKTFSRKFDDTVTQAEEWMKINMQSPGEKGMFKFGLDPEEFLQIKEIVGVVEQASSVITPILELLWGKTESALLALRERLNGEFKLSIDTIFSETIETLIITKGDLALLDLMQAFTRARNEIKEDINTASEWFNRSENSEIAAGTLDKLIKIAVRSFEKVRGNAFSITIDDPENLQEISINKQVAKPFILAIINLLDNCYAHSGLGQDTHVKISGSVKESLATVKIENSLSLDKQELLRPERLSEIRGKLESNDVAQHIRGEGGTGLIKAKHEISYLGRESRLAIGRQGNTFIADITYNYLAAI